jgi:ribonuclease H / adenosylcobalamin/alpha-ribazole phosphatase
MREKEPTTRVIYVRHGKTDFPTDRIYCDDREDPPLNAEGLDQARLASELLHAQSVDVIYSSPSRRTRMTADEIARRVEAPIIEDGALYERRFGIWEGLYFADIAQRYSREYQAWRQDPVHYTPEGGETIEGVQARVTAFAQRMIAEHCGKTIVVVSHVGPIRLCMTTALQIPVQWYRQLRIDYGSLTRVDYGESQNNLVYANVYKSLF